MNIPAYFLNRATVRHFDTSRQISEADIDRLLLAAAHAPSTGNMQLYNAIVTTDPDELKELAALHYNQPAATGCTAMVTFCADVRRFGTWCDCRHAKNSLDNAGGRLTAICDTSIFAQQFVTLAEMAGLGTCYLGTVTYDIDGFMAALGIPEGGDVIPVLAVAVGYPAEKTKGADRLPADAVISHGRYHDAGASDIDKYYAEKESLEDSARYTAENTKETLAQVYSEVRYPAALNEALGRKLISLIENRR